MIQVSVHSAALREQPYNDKKTGERKVLHFQTLWLHLIGRNGEAEPYPTKLEVIADVDQRNGMPTAYQPGKYSLHPSAIYIDRDNRLAVAPRLVAIKA